MGDIGTHAENLARYITGLEIEELCADFTTFGKGRKLEDDANFLLRYKGGARGVLHASQISSGEENDLNIRIYGTKGSLAWRQEEPNRLVMKSNDGPQKVFTRGNAWLLPAARGATRLPPGHPEAFLEAFANIYAEAGRAMTDQIEGRKPKGYDFPTVDDGVTGVAFIETAVKSARSKQKWTRMPSLR